MQSLFQSAPFNCTKHASQELAFYCTYPSCQSSDNPICGLCWVDHLSHPTYIIHISSAIELCQQLLEQYPKMQVPQKEFNKDDNSKKVLAEGRQLITEITDICSSLKAIALQYEEELKAADFIMLDASEITEEKKKHIQNLITAFKTSGVRNKSNVCEIMQVYYIIQKEQQDVQKQGEK